MSLFNNAKSFCKEQCGLGNPLSEGVTHVHQLGCAYNKFVDEERDKTTKKKGELDMQAAAMDANKAEINARPKEHSQELKSLLYCSPPTA